MTRAKLFRSKGLQAIRLDDNVAFPSGVREVTILRDGDRRVIVPADRRWDDFFDAPGITLGERDQPEAQVRRG
jgi:antitoxin VapB